MKILTLTKFYHPYRGGIETVCKNINESNVAAGHTSDVLCANTAFRFSHNIIEGVKVIRSPRLFTLKSTSICPFMPWQLRSLIPQYDLIHVHFPDPMTALSLFLAKPNIPYVVHWHNDIFKQRKLMPFFGPLQRWCLENAKYIIATTESYAAHSADLQPFKHKIKIIPIGINCSRAFVSKKPSREKTILTVGRLAYYKGLHNIIGAARLLPEEYKFRIVGSGELQDDLKELIGRNNLSDRVILVGQKVDQDLETEYESSDLFCFPSTHKAESFGVVQIEAMTHSLPIVACNIDGSGVPWVNLHEISGLNVSIDNPQELADAIRSIVESPELYEKYSKGSYNRFQSEFRLDSMMQKIWVVYFEMTHSFPVSYCKN